MTCRYRSRLGVIRTPNMDRLSSSAHGIRLERYDSLMMKESILLTASLVIIYMNSYEVDRPA
jgi:hypothetical protein